MYSKPLSFWALTKIAEFSFHTLRCTKQIDFFRSLFCYHGGMTGHSSATITPRAKDFLAEKYASSSLVVLPVEGGYSRNRRAIIEVNGQSLFAKEVDVDILPDDGKVELAWLKKDYGVVSELSKMGVEVAPDWAELDMDGHLLLLPSYKQEDGWLWSLPVAGETRTRYIQAVVHATKQLEATVLPENLTEKLSLQPYFRDEIAYYEGVTPLFADGVLRRRLIEKYTDFQQKGGHLLPVNVHMVETLGSDESLKDLQQATARLAGLPNSHLNHCDVRSDNIAYNEKTGEVKFVDWNWASYAPAKFGATEFILDMARRGADVSPWFDDISVDLLAGMVGYFMIRSLKEPLSTGSTLRDMQAETAAVANYLYGQLK